MTDDQVLPECSHSSEYTRLPREFQKKRQAAASTPLRALLLEVDAPAARIPRKASGCCFYSSPQDLVDRPAVLDLQALAARDLEAA